MNAVIIEGKPVGESVLQGEGAGPGPTSSSLLSFCNDMDMFCH